jgi:hypothetical protein
LPICQSAVWMRRSMAWAVRIGVEGLGVMALGRPYGRSG